MSIATPTSPESFRATQCLPDEIYEYIIDFLWDDVAALLQCSLVCRNFRPCAQYHLIEYNSDTLSISARRVLIAHGRAFRTREAGSFRQRFPFANTIRMTDDPQAPFVHLFPVLMIGSDVPWVKTLNIHQLDWTSTHPHACFFDYLGYYVKVRTLHLKYCRFRSTSQLRKLINALPNLETITLDAMDGNTLPHTLTSTPTYLDGSALRVNSKVRCITASVYPGEGDRLFPMNSTLRFVVQSVLSLCGLYSGVTKLMLHIGLFDSLKYLVHFLSFFPRLDTLLLYPRRRSGDCWPATTDFEALLMSPFPRLRILRLFDIPQRSTRDMMNLVSVPRMANAIQELDIQNTDSIEPTADSMDAIASAVLHSGPALGFLIVPWACHPNSPRLDLQANTTLDKLTVVYCGVSPILRTIEDTLVSLISSITSPYLVSINLTMVISDGQLDAYQFGGPGNGEPQEEEQPVRDLSTFHAFLDASFSLEPDMVSMVFKVPTSKATRAAVHRFRTLLSTRLAALFAPWAESGILYLRMDPKAGDEDDAEYDAFAEG